MASNWHNTSVQAARQQTYTADEAAAKTATYAPQTTIGGLTSFAVGIKRAQGQQTGDKGNSGNAGIIPKPSQQPLGPPLKRQATGPLPTRPAKLTASPIVDVEKEEDFKDAKDAQEQTRPAWLPQGVTEYSQRRVIKATPTVAQDPLLSLAHPIYGLPARVVANFEGMGIQAIYPWQKQCLLAGGSDSLKKEDAKSLLDGSRNLVYAAPTGGGKSLVADVLMLKRVLSPQQTASQPNPASKMPISTPVSKRPKALLVLPFVALVQEKVRWLRRVVDGLVYPGPPVFSGYTSTDSVRVVGFFGGAKIRATWNDFDIGVATIEKANALINTAIDDCTIGDLSVVVLDELHMIDDAHRGYLLELLATKLLCLDHHVQIVGMSATLNWLDAYFYQTRYRPIPIEEHIVYDGHIYSAEDTQPLSLSSTQEIKNPKLPLPALRRIHKSLHKELSDPVTNAVVALAAETALAGYGALVFVSSRASAENVALLISRTLPSSLADLRDLHTKGEIKNTDLDEAWESRLDLLSELQSLPTASSDNTLLQTVLSGVGYHHAGMTAEERDLVATGYDRGVLKVCVATCTLAAGINLPARRVILHNARMGRELVGPAMLRQMRGRAGRKGKDEVGETYLCCRETDVEDVIDLMHAELPDVGSVLARGENAEEDEDEEYLDEQQKAEKLLKQKQGLEEERGRRLQRAMLEVVAIRLATSRESLDDYVKKTMLYADGTNDANTDAHKEKKRQKTWDDVENSLEALKTKGFVELDNYGGLQATRFGRAVVVSALDPADALFVRGELERALQAFVLDGEMHILYTFTPINDSGGAISWPRFGQEMDSLDDSGMRVLQLLGLQPSVIMRLQGGGSLPERTPEEKKTARVYRRFYLALQLRDLCNEMPVHRVAQKYNVARGAVQTLAQTCEGFAAGMIKFCEHMGWGPMAAVLEHFVDRLKAGAKADLLALARIAFVKSRTARIFWENGYKSVAAVANANPGELVPILIQAQASRMRFTDAASETKFKDKMAAKAQIITESANRIWQIEMQRDLEEE